MLKFFKTNFEADMSKKSKPTADMYQAHVLAKIVRAGHVIAAMSIIMGLWVIASVILPSVTQLTAASFGKKSWFILIPLLACGVAIAAAVVTEGNPAVFRLHPVRPTVDNLDEWERDMRRRVAEKAFQKTALGGVYIMGAFGAVVILDVMHYNPSVPILSLFVAALAMINGITATLYRTIGKLAAPSQ